MGSKPRCKSPPPAHPENPHKLLNGNLCTQQKDTSNKATENPAQRLPNAYVQAPKAEKKTCPSPQLVAYIHSPVMANPYTGAQGVAGLESAVRCGRSMKSLLRGWEEDWDKMSAGRNK